ncbi:hypothetical protein PGB90_006743 [Kerria lacca]
MGRREYGATVAKVPPDILDYPTSTDMVVREGSNVSLRCAASGSPAPNITWKRENSEIIPLGNGVEVASVEGSVLNITRVNRMHMGPYLCIASNGVPPSVSKRIMLIVNFPPMIWIQNQLIGAYEGQQLTLECHSEAYPKSINYWSKGDVIAYVNEVKAQVQTTVEKYRNQPILVLIRRTSDIVTKTVTICKINTTSCPVKLSVDWLGRIHIVSDCIGLHFVDRFLGGFFDQCESMLSGLLRYYSMCDIPLTDFSDFGDFIVIFSSNVKCFLVLS